MQCNILATLLGRRFGISLSFIAWQGQGTSEKMVIGTRSSSVCTICKVGKRDERRLKQPDRIKSRKADKLPLQGDNCEFHSPSNRSHLSSPGNNTPAFRLFPQDRLDCLTHQSSSSSFNLKLLRNRMVPGRVISPTPLVFSMI